MKKTIFTPDNDHILIEPEQITDVAKEIKGDDGVVRKIFMNDHTVDKIVAAVNKGRVMASSSKRYSIIDTILVYYPFSANKIKIDEKDYHVIHERDVMGKVEVIETT